jgi:hypothetical protein
MDLPNRAERDAAAQETDGTSSTDTDEEETT